LKFIFRNQASKHKIQYAIYTKIVLRSFYYQIFEILYIMTETV